MATWRTEDADPLRRQPTSHSMSMVGSATRPISGILIVDKPAGITSHDVVARLRKLAGQRRVGHAGTLDPLATGVLLVCLGQATRLAEYLARHDKSYRAIVEFGRATDTYDRDGRVVFESAGPLPARDEVGAALQHFQGTIEQTPPSYSAVKVRGQPSYRRARRGDAAELRPRSVRVDRIVMTEWHPPHVTLEIDCSAGTYVRALAHDLGVALGCGAHLRELVRTRSGEFVLVDAVPLGALEAAPGDAWQRHLLPMDVAVGDLPALELTDDEAARVGFGQAIAAPSLDGAAYARLYDAGGRFLAVAEYDADGLWHPAKVFPRRDVAGEECSPGSRA